MRPYRNRNAEDRDHSARIPVRRRRNKRSLRHSHQLEDVTVRVLEINASAAIPVIELAVVEAPGSAAVRKPSLLDALEDSVELGVAHVEGIVVTVKRGVLVEQERQRLVYADRREVVALLFVKIQTESVCKKPGGGHLVARRHDGVV